MPKPKFAQTPENVAAFRRMWESPSVSIADMVSHFGFAGPANLYHYRYKYGLGPKAGGRKGRPLGRQPAPVTPELVARLTAGGVIGDVAARPEVRHWPPERVLTPDAAALAVFADPEFLRLGAIWYDAQRKELAGKIPPPPAPPEKPAILAVRDDFPPPSQPGLTEQPHAAGDAPDPDRPAPPAGPDRG